MRRRVDLRAALVEGAGERENLPERMAAREGGWVRVGFADVGCNDLGLLLGVIAGEDNVGCERESFCRRCDIHA